MCGNRVYLKTRGARSFRLHKNFGGLRSASQPARLDFVNAKSGAVAALLGRTGTVGESLFCALSAVVARLHDTQEVAGSIPAGRTELNSVESLIEVSNLTRHSWIYIE